MAGGTTSALDDATELRVEMALDALRADGTRVSIAHCLSTVCGAHLIVVLDAGRIVEQGAHDELLALGGRYTALVAAQREAKEIAGA